MKVVIIFSEDAILNGHAYAIHPDTVNIQLPDKDCFGPELIDAVRHVVKEGYSISIDDDMAYPNNDNCLA